MSTPRLSVGMPVFNGEKYLAESLRSLLVQEFEDFELIISDNASTDRTEEICREYASKDRRIQYHRLDTNYGAAANYNRVFELARARYFKWAAHDDVCAPSYLGRCVTILDGSRSGPVLTYGKTVLIDEDGAVIRNYEDHLDLRSALPHQRFRSLLQNLVLCNALVGVIRSDALRATRLIQGFAASDVVLLAELALRGEFWEIPEPLFFRRVQRAQSPSGGETPSHKQGDSSVQAVAAWFAPGKRRQVALPRMRLLVEHVRAIHRAPLGWLQKMDCFDVLFEERVFRQHRWRTLGSEVRSALKTLMPLMMRNGRHAGSARQEHGAG